MLTKDDLKAIVDAINPLVNARAKTTETVIKSHVSSEIERAKEELTAEILATKAELKADILTLDSKLVKKINNHERRIENLEHNTGTQDPTKN